MRFLSAPHTIAEYRHQQFRKFEVLGLTATSAIALGGLAVGAGGLAYQMSQGSKGGGGGGSSYGGIGSNYAQPPAPLDYNQILAQANAGAQQQSQSILSAYPQYTDAALGTIGTLASNLNDANTAQAYNWLGQAGGAVGNINSMAQNVAGVAPQIGQQGDNLASLGGFMQGYGTQQLANAGPNAIENNLMGQANSNLSLGSSLSNEDARQATQQAQASFAQNGLGNSAGAAATGILDRYQLGQQRLQQRQGAAVQADNTVNSNVIARQGVGLSALGQAGNNFGNAASAYGQEAGAYGTAGNLYGTAGNLATNVAAGYIAADPYQRALNPGIAISGQALGSLGQTYSGQNQLAGDVASFNTNMGASMYNANQTNQAAMYAAQLQSQATQQASQNSLMGSGLGALGSLGGAYLQSQAGNGYGLPTAQQAYGMSASSALGQANSQYLGSNGQYFQNLL